MPAHVREIMWKISRRKLSILAGRVLDMKARPRIKHPGTRQSAISRRDGGRERERTPPRVRVFLHDKEKKRKRTKQETVEIFITRTARRFDKNRFPSGV